jgi:phage regulator Rha-like protein
LRVSVEGIAMQIVGYESIEDKIIEIHQQHVIIDSDVAELYGVETKRINEAVKNNQDKFPEGYLLTISEQEKMVENFDRFKSLKHSTVLPKAFTEKGMYMLATILKSPKATETTISIIETFAKVREISRTIKAIPQTPQDSLKYQELMQKTGDLISELIVPDDLDTSETESSIEINLVVVKFKYTVKKKR